VSEFAGSCACGAVTYEFDGPPKVTVACHCSKCRKATGAAFAMWSLVPKESFRFTSGTEHIEEFASSEQARRLFCRRCGSTLGNRTSKRPQFFHLAAGTLDRAPDVRFAFHVHVASKAPWYDIADALPRHDEEPAPRAAGAAKL